MIAPRTTPHPRAFTLIEMVAMVVLLAVFMLVFSELFKATYLGHRNAVRRDNLDLRVDAAMGSLRRDVWAAHAMTFANGALTLTLDDRSTTRWQFGPTWTRTLAGDHITRWTGMPADAVDAQVRGPVLTLTFGGRGGEGLGVKTTPETIAFVSQVMLGGGS
jgi:type II secretory pathway component PulJ